ncbi:MAG: hypothetical protein ACK479_10725 [Fluviicola sp.]
MNKSEKIHASLELKILQDYQIQRQQLIFQNKLTKTFIRNSFYEMRINTLQNKLLQSKKEYLKLLRLSFMIITTMFILFAISG